jgi:uncharacterized protein YeaO (DUF488 family)
VNVVEGRLYTGRIYDHARIKAEYPKVLRICVMRWPPRFIKLKENGITHFTGLSPPAKLLAYYKKREKNEKNWKSFVEKMVEHLETDDMARKDIFSLRYLLLAGTQVVLLCHEKADENCHRHILPQIVLTEEDLNAGVYKGELCFDETIQLRLDW